MDVLLVSGEDLLEDFNGNRSLFLLSAAAQLASTDSRDAVRGQTADTRSLRHGCRSRFECQARRLGYPRDSCPHCVHLRADLGRQRCEIV